MPGMHGSHTAFGKRLGSNEKEVRDKATDALLNWLRGAQDVSEPEMDKLWEGLFFSVWMSDKPLVQQELNEKLASSLLSIHPTNRMAFYKSYWRVMGQQWFHIDKHRINKCGQLARFVLRYTYKLLQQEGWASEVVDQVNQVLATTVLDYSNNRLPIGLQSQLIDCVLEELDVAIAKEERETIPFARLLEPYIQFLANSRNSVTVGMVAKEIFRPILAKRADPDYLDENSYFDRELPLLKAALVRATPPKPAARDSGKKKKNQRPLPSPGAGLELMAKLLKGFRNYYPDPVQSTLGKRRSEESSKPMANGWPTISSEEAGEPSTRPSKRSKVTTAETSAVATERRPARAQIRPTVLTTAARAHLAWKRDLLLAKKRRLDIKWTVGPVPPSSTANLTASTVAAVAQVQAVSPAGTSSPATPSVGGSPRTPGTKKSVHWSLECNSVKLFRKALPITPLPTAIRFGDPAKPSLRRVGSNDSMLSGSSSPSQASTSNSPAPMASLNHRAVAAGQSSPTPTTRMVSPLAVEVSPAAVTTKVATVTTTSTVGLDTSTWGSSAAPPSPAGTPTRPTLVTETTFKVTPVKEHLNSPATTPNRSTAQSTAAADNSNETGDGGFQVTPVKDFLSQQRPLKAVPQTAPVNRETPPVFTVSPHRASTPRQTPASRRRSLVPADTPRRQSSRLAAKRK
ncbi:hypothetical protein IWQ60_010781 [Tieghemiomyces parasiticus]|uniref:Uncharacterized protein n=1 Tax=Tieghemiomyces parasiticus TaxID=78921 RepID=A0A9W7ZIU8_9FUNG|nr:hypothetical protein IWQ60_010781 [Tieghemiomyces parasiticus]